MAHLLNWKCSESWVKIVFPQGDLKNHFHIYLCICLVCGYVYVCVHACVYVYISVCMKHSAHREVSVCGNIAHIWRSEDKP